MSCWIYMYTYSKCLENVERIPLKIQLVLTFHALFFMHPHIRVGRKLITWHTKNVTNAIAVMKSTLTKYVPTAAIVKLSFHVRSNLWKHPKCVPLTDMITVALAFWHFSVFIYAKKWTQKHSCLYIGREKPITSLRCNYNYSSSTHIFTEVFRINKPMSALRYLKKYQIPYEILWSARTHSTYTLLKASLSHGE